MSRVDEIFKALRMVPEFDGNTNVLTRFIKLCDQLVATYVSREPGSEFANLALINGILNKVTGPAARLINTNGIPENWTGIRSALVNNFSDQRDETSLYNDLALLTQGSSTPQEYYETCQNLFGTIMTYVSLHETVQTTIESKRNLYQKLTLQSYLRGLRDPLGSRIRCMRPETIEKALEFVQEEMNTLYLQQRNDRIIPDRKSHSHLNNSSSNMGITASQIAPMPTRQPFNFNMPGPSRPGFAMHPQRPPLPWRPNINQPQPLQGPSRTQQAFGARPPNYNPFRFQPPRAPNSNDTPKPMSGVSHFVPKPMPFRGHDWSRGGNPPPSNYFRTREMNFNECYDYFHQNEPYDNLELYQYDYDGYPDYYSYYCDTSMSQLPIPYSDACVAPPAPPVEAPAAAEGNSCKVENFQKDQGTNERK